MSIDRLAAKVAALPLNARGRRRYPQALRIDALRTLSASDLSSDAFAEKIGVPNGTIASWKASASKSPAKWRPSAFKTIAVEPATKPATMVSLRTPDGVVVEGLSIAAAADLIAALSGRV